MKRCTLSLVMLTISAALRAGTAEDSLMIRQENLIQQVIDQIHLDSLLCQVRILSGEQQTVIDGTPRTIVSRHRLQPGNALAADYIFQELARHGLDPFIDSFGTQGENVVAFQQGSLFPEKQYMICAHYDCMPPGNIAYGADDNASGTAAVLEAARLLARQRLPYTIVYALWDEEEAGLIGARAYAARVAALGHQILGVINMDMIAWDGNKDTIVTLHVRPIAQSLDLAERLVDINSNYQIGLDPWLVNPGTPNSDHSAFWEQGYSAVLIIEDYRRNAGVNDFNPYYHSLDDRIMVGGAMIFDPGYFLRCARMSIATLFSFALDVTPAAPGLLATTPEAPVRTLLAWQPAARSREYRVQLAQDPAFQTIEQQLQVAGETFCVPGRLAYHQDYFWRVSGINRGGRGEWSAPGSFITTGPRQQILTLSPGWNLVSAGVAPDDSAFASLLPGSGLLLRDGSGRRYGADYGWHERQVWSSLEGYWIHTPDTTHLLLQGWEINTAPAPLPLKSGWQIMPYWRTAPMSVGVLLSSLGRSHALLKDAAGRLCWPQEGIHQIAALEPGQAYQLYLDAPDTLLLPLNDVAVSAGNGDADRVNSPRHYRPLSGTGVTAHLMLTTGELRSGDEVGIWANGQILVGAGVVERNKTLITLWGDDIATPEKTDGALPGDPLNVTVWNESENLERALLLEGVVDLNGSGGSSHLLYFSPDGVWRADVGGIEPIPASFALYQNYPNPFNNATVIRYVLPSKSKFLLRILNLQGQEVARLAEGEQSTGICEASFKGEGLASGIYWAELQAGGKTSRIKMTLVR